LPFCLSAALCSRAFDLGMIDDLKSGGAELGGEAA
jgi:hypothetical protein